MEENEIQQTTQLITQDFEMEPVEESLTEEQLLDLLAQQIAYMIDHKMEFLLSLMYRLDINEAKVNRALSPFAEEAAHIGLARLVLERQKQRVRTKREYRQPILDDNWEDWD